MAIEQKARRKEYVVDCFTWDGTDTAKATDFFTPNPAALVSTVGSAPNIVLTFTASGTNLAAPASTVCPIGATIVHNGRGQYEFVTATAFASDFDLIEDIETLGSQG